MNWKIFGGSTSATVLGGLLVFLAFQITSDPLDSYVTLAILILASCIGWLMGILLSPYDSREKSEFSEYSKAFAAFVSGYAVSKIDKVIESILTPAFVLQPVSGFRVIGFLSMFILGLLVTFIYRKYARV